MSFINHNSLIIISFLILASVAFILLRDGIHTRDLLVLGGLAILMGIIWIIIRPTPSDYENESGILNQIGGGLPVLLELQSPY